MQAFTGDTQHDKEACLAHIASFRDSDDPICLAHWYEDLPLHLQEDPDLIELAREILAQISVHTACAYFERLVAANQLDRDTSIRKQTASLGNFELLLSNADAADHVAAHLPTRCLLNLYETCKDVAHSGRDLKTRLTFTSLDKHTPDNERWRRIPTIVPDNQALVCVPSFVDFGKFQSPEQRIAFARDWPMARHRVREVAEVCERVTETFMFNFIRSLEMTRNFAFNPDEALLDELGGYLRIANGFRSRLKELNDAFKEASICAHALKCVTWEHIVQEGSLPQDQEGVLELWRFIKGVHAYFQ